MRLVAFHFRCFAAGTQHPPNKPAIEQDEYDQNDSPLHEARHDTEGIKRVEPSIRGINAGGLVEPPSEEYGGKRWNDEANCRIPERSRVPVVGLIVDVFFTKT